MQATKTMDAMAWVLLLLLSVIWGAGFVFAGIAVKELPPLTVVFVRVFLASITLLPIFWYCGHLLPRNIFEWAPFASMGLLNNAIPFGLIFAGQTQISVGLSSIINAMTPLFTILVMASFGEERLTTYRVIGVLLGVGGVAVLQGFGGPMAGAQTLGVGLCLSAALSYGFAALWGRRYLAAVPPLKSATCQLMCSTMIMAVAASIVDQPWRLDAPSQSVVLSLLALAVPGTALAYILFFQIVVRAGASNVMLVTLLIPITAVLLGHGLLGEPVRSREIAGAVLIGLGLLFIDGRMLRLVTGQPANSG